MDTIFLQQLRIPTTIGVWEWERRIKQSLVIDVEAAIDNKKAAASDDLEDALNYKDMAQRIEELVSESSFKLIETAAERIAEIILDEFGASWCKVTVNKPKAVEIGRNVGVAIERGKRTKRS